MGEADILNHYPTLTTKKRLTWLVKHDYSSTNSKPIQFNQSDMDVESKSRD
jgi:hypothetical protein